MHECQEAVSGNETVRNHSNLPQWLLTSKVTVSPLRMQKMTASQSGKPTLQRRLRNWYVTCRQYLIQLCEQYYVSLWFNGTDGRVFIVMMCVSGPGEGGRQQPEGRHQQTQVSDCGVSRGAEDSDGEDEGECQAHQELHRE